MRATAQSPQPIVLAETWRRYTRMGDREARNQLVLAYSPIVKYAAGRIAARMPAHVELAELVSYGLAGLIGAVERFDPARGVKFEAYAAPRIRGAILDELRSLDWVPRSVRGEARKIEEATVALSSRLHRVPTDAELAAEMSIDAEELDAILQRVDDSRMLALDQTWDVTGTGGVETTLLQTLPDASALNPSANADATDLRERIADAITHLADREQLILGLRYRQDLRLAEISEILGLSESRISQLHAKAVLQVRALLPDDHDPPRLTSARARARRPRRR
jgi:RNA polymerase sigma factor for flagellar operon FliA